MSSGAVTPLGVVDDMRDMIRNHHAVETNLTEGLDR
jgi:hypothetical protein